MLSFYVWKVLFMCLFFPVKKINNFREISHWYVKLSGFLFHVWNRVKKKKSWAFSSQDFFFSKCETEQILFLFVSFFMCETFFFPYVKPIIWNWKKHEKFCFISWGKKKFFMYHFLFPIFPTFFHVKIFLNNFFDMKIFFHVLSYFFYLVKCFFFFQVWHIVFIDVKSSQKSAFSFQKK